MISIAQFCYIIIIFCILNKIYQWFRQPENPPFWVNNDTYPLCLKVTGFHFLFLGFNGLYYRTNESVNGSPVYKMPPYVLYNLIPIRPVNLYKNEKGYWKFQYADCYEDIAFLHGHVESPIGYYFYKYQSRDVKVEKAIIRFDY